MGAAAQAASGPCYQSGVDRSTALGHNTDVPQRPTELLTLRANGLRFVARAAGAGPLALLLHGFPDHADSMDLLLHNFAAAGYRAVAPYMRGYWPTEVPGTAPTTLWDLAGDVVGLIRALGAQEATVVGHDWGAAAGYAAAITAPGAVRALVAMSVPPLPRVLAGLGPRQIWHSRYMLRFQAPGAARALRADDCALVERLWRRWSPEWTPPPEALVGVRRCLSQPGCARAAVGYYRGLFRSTALAELARRPIHVPTLVLGGLRDRCLGADLYHGSARGLRGRHEVALLPAGHFLPLEAPAAVAERALRFLRA